MDSVLSNSTVYLMVLFSRSSAYQKTFRRKGFLLLKFNLNWNLFWGLPGWIYFCQVWQRVKWESVGLGEAGMLISNFASLSLSLKLSLYRFTTVHIYRNYQQTDSIATLNSPRTAKNQCRKFETNTPSKRIAQPQSNHFHHSCVRERFIHSTIDLPILLQENTVCGPILGIYKSLTDIGMWNCDWTQFPEKKYINGIFVAVRVPHVHVHSATVTRQVGFCTWWTGRTACLSLTVPVGDCSIRSCPAARWWNFQLLLYSKCIQPSVMSYVTQGRHGLVL